MTNKLRSVRSGSKSAASPQSKIEHRNAPARPAPERPRAITGADPSKLNPAQAELARIAGNLELLTGKRYRSALDRIGYLEKHERARLLHEAARAETVTCVFTLPDGSEVARVGFPREDFSLIKRAAARRCVTLEQFFIIAIRHYVEKFSRRRGA